MYKYASLLWVHAHYFEFHLIFESLVWDNEVKQELKDTSKQLEPRILPDLFNLSQNSTAALSALNLPAVFKQFAFIKSFPSIQVNFHGNDNSITFILTFRQYCNIYLIL